MSPSPPGEDRSPWIAAALALLGWCLLAVAVAGLASRGRAGAAPPPGVPGTGADTGAPVARYVVAGRVFLEGDDDPQRLAPAAACRVRLVDRTSLDPRAEASCGPGGGFELVLDGGRPSSVAVEISVPGRLRAVLDPVADALAVGPARTRLRDVALGRAVAVAGHVLDARGDPIAGASVTARPVPDLGEPIPWRVTSDGAGRFAFSDLPTGPVRLSAEAPGHAPASLVVWAPEDAVDLVLDPVGTVAGRVEAPAGVAGPVVVRLAGGSLWPPREVPAAPGGSFVFEDVPGTWFLLDAYAEGPDGGYAAEPVEVEGPAAPSLRLSPAGAVEVRVTDPAGRAVRGAFVAVRRGPVDALARRGRTDLGGRVTLRGIVPGPVDVAAVAEGYLPASPRAVRVEAGRTVRVVLRLGAPATLEGRVVDAHGRPVAGAEVELAPVAGGRAAATAATALGVARRATPSAGDRLPAHPGPVPAIPADFAGAGARGRTGPDGRFRWVGLRPGRYRGRALDAAGTLWSEAYDVRLRAGAVTRVEWVLAEGVPVEGRVVDPNLRPVPRARVLFDRGFEVRTDEAGAFAGTVPAGGPLAAWVVAPGYAPAAVTIDPEARDGPIEVSLSPADARLEVRVLDGNARPVTGARLTLRSDRPEPPRTAVTDDRGLARFEGLVRGRYRIEAVAAGYAVARARAEAASSGAFVEVALAPALEVAVIVTDAVSGRPVEGARVRALGAGEEGAAVTDGRGRARLAGLSVWPEAIEVQAPRFVPVRHAVPARGAGAGPPLRIALDRAGALEGVVRDDLGEVVGGATVEARGAGGRSLGSVVTDPGGRFAFEALPEGPVTIVARPPPGRRDLGAGRVASDVLADRTTRGVDVRLVRR